MKNQNTFNKSDVPCKFQYRICIQFDFKFKTYFLSIFLLYRVYEKTFAGLYRTAKIYFKRKGLVENTISSSPKFVLESDLPFITESTTSEIYFDEKAFGVASPPQRPDFLPPPGSVYYQKKIGIRQGSVD